MGNYGQLGDNDTTSHSITVPYFVNALNGTKIIAIAAGGYHSIVLTGK
jgi:hypothetical protein